MGSPKQLANRDEWLSLEQASVRLGVHPTTLRRWADGGTIDVFVTPGGHRRFRATDLEMFRQRRYRASPPATPRRGWIDHALAQTRQEIPNQRWVAAYGEAERESHRSLGRQLMGRVLQYIARPDESPELLREARTNGEQHGRAGLLLGQRLADLLQALNFFRTTMIEVAILQMTRSVDARSEPSVRLLRRIEKLLGEVQAGVVDAYLAGQDKDETTRVGEDLALGGGGPASSPR